MSERTFYLLVSFFKFKKKFRLSPDEKVTIYCYPIVAQKKNSLFFVSIKVNSGFLRRGFLKLTSIEVHLGKICQSDSISVKERGQVD